MTTKPTLARRLAAPGAALAALCAAAAALALSGRALPFPALSSPTGIMRWAAEADIATVVFTAARGLAVVLVCWTAFTWLLAVVARLAMVPAAVMAADDLALPFVRRLADLTAGVAVVAVSLVPATQAGAATVPDASPLVVMSDLGPTSPVTTTTTSGEVTTTTTRTATTADPTPVTPPTMSAVDDTPPTSSGQLPVTSLTTVEAADHDAAVTGTWVIRPGDTLWHVAERSVGELLGHPPTPAETATQLDRLVALNTDRLVVPGDADLVFPGQEFVLP